MKNSKVLKTILFLSGLLLIAVGTAILLTPVAFTARNGIDLGGNISLLNDIRGNGGVLLGSGVLIMLGAFIHKLSFTSIMVSIVVYLSFGMARVLSIILDGMPADGLVKATSVEIIFGLVCVFAFLKYREKG